MGRVIASVPRENVMRSYDVGELLQICRWNSQTGVLVNDDIIGLFHW
jgi:hypothetical protein